MSRYMRRNVRLEMHDEYGIPGLKPLWMPDHQSDPLTGMGLAHDVLEHGGNDVCEWQGLGGAIFVRADTGYFCRGRGNPDPVENIASDFVELFHLWEGVDIPTPRFTPRGLDDSTIDTIDQIVAKGCALVVSEIGYSHDATETRHARHWTRVEQRERMRAWMMHGYRACAHRWRLVSDYAVLETFLSIERCADAFLRDNADALGAEAVLSFSVREQNARIEMVEEEYGYDED